MSTYRLDKLFAPRSVALVGASLRKGSLGNAVLSNLSAGGFLGRIELVNPRYTDIGGVRCVPRIDDLEEPADVAVIAAPRESVPEIVEAAGKCGVASAIIITAGLGHGSGSLAETVRQEARKSGLRLVGPNCLGVMAPPSKLNASFAARQPLEGDLALISQSGAVAAGLVEWASQRGIGFTGVVSLGDGIDVDFGDCVDFFSADPGTRAILLYVEAIVSAQKFMSAARAAARIKPVVVIKSGRHAPAAKAAATHTGALAGHDAVYEAAFRRAGLLRVLDMDELFAAAESLGRKQAYLGRRLAVLTNGGGVGVLAVDRLMDLGGCLASISEETLARLDAVLPATWSRGNPVDIIGDADADRYALALQELLADKNNEAVLVLNVPTALASAADAAAAVAETVRRQGSPSAGLKKPVFSVWLGEDGAAARTFAEAGIPHYSNEADAVRGFMHVVRYRDAQDQLMQTPDSLPADFAPDVATAQSIVADVIADGRKWLTSVEVGDLLRAYHVPIVPAAVARNAEEAAQLAQPILTAGSTVAVKILSPDIVHKSDVGGVRLDLTSRDAVCAAAQEVMDRARHLKPDARITGVTVQAMVRRPKARELIAGLADDPTFGPVIVFGQGGTAVEVIDDKALALPPLDLGLAYDLIGRTRVARILKTYRDVPAADERAVALLLVKVAQLAADLPEVRELDINPFLADADGVIAVDARVAVAPENWNGTRHPRFSIRPYPKEWERELTLRDGERVFVRPVRPDDEGLVRDFLQRVTPEDLRLRFFAPVRTFPHPFVARLIQIDYSREIVFVAVDPHSGAMLGAVRLHADANHESGEYAVLVRSDTKGRGLGWQLMRLITEWARAEGLRTIKGEVLSENVTMLQMCRELGFTIRSDPGNPGILNVERKLTGEEG